MRLIHVNSVDNELGWFTLRSKQKVTK